MRVLLVSHMFPPANAIGAVRIGKLAKYLVGEGHEVRILAGRPKRLPQTLPLEVPEELVTYVEDSSILDSGFGPLGKVEERYRRGEVRLGRGLQQLLKLFRTVVHFPDAQIAWLPTALAAGRRLLAKWRPDVIYASASPATSLIIARMLAKRSGVPWIGELRDLWVDNHYYDHPPARRALERRLEKWTLNSASALVTVSEPLAQVLRQKFAKPTSVVLNGFDADDFRDVPEPIPDPDAPVTIVYTGLIYPGRRDPTPLFQALRQLGPKASRVRVAFYGRLLPELKRLVEEYGIEGSITVNPPVSYRESLALQRRADALLLLLWNSPEERGVFTGKLFEYVGARRPILAIGCADGVAAALVRDRQIGVVANEPDALAGILDSWISEKERFGKLADPATEAVVGLSRNDQFSRVSELLERIKLRKPTSPRVTIVAPRLDVGGTERHLQRILPRLRGEGIEPTVFVLERGGKLEPEFKRIGFDVEGPPRGPHRVLNVARASAELFVFLLKHRPDIVHFFLAEPYLIGSFAAKAAGIRHTVMSRRSLANYQSRYPTLARLECWLHARTSILLGNSRAVVAELVAESRTPAKVGLIHNGVEIPLPSTVASRSAQRKALGLADDELVLMIVANLIHYKGHADLLDALSIAHGRIPQGWRLLVIGRDDGIGKALREQSQHLGIFDNILWLAERIDIDAMMEVADLFVLASHEEGFSNALLEAMARGIPVLATAVGGNPDAVVHRESGLLVEAHSPESMAAALIELCNDGELRGRLGRAGRARIEQLFSLEACTRRYTAVYRGFDRVPGVVVQEIIDSPCPTAAAATATAAKSELESPL